MIEKMQTRRRGRLMALALPCLAGLLAACATDLVNPQIPPPGPPAFEEGYVDGCYSGFTDAGRDGYQQSYRKDTVRYARETDYKQGWGQGYAACFEEEKRHPKVLGGDGDGHHHREGGTGGTGGGGGHGGGGAGR